MTTIRARLTGRLLAGWALLLAAGLGAAWWCAAAALTREFDDALRARAMALTALTEQNEGRIEVEMEGRFMREFDPDVRTAFFQVWRADGRPVARSGSLRGENLPLRCGVDRAPEFWNLRLPTGSAGRALGLRFQPQSGDGARQGIAAAEAYLVVAAARGDLDRTLGVLALVLTGSGVLMLLLAAWTVPPLLHRELAPLARLARQAQGITAASLSDRFPTADLPGELAPIASRLNDLLQRLQTAFERERRFSDDLAHEFRTPIAELRSAAELALKWPDARSADADRSVLAIAVQMESIITRLLAISRAEEGRMPVSPEPVDLAELVASVCLPLRAQAAARAPAIETIVPEALEIFSDAVLLRSIVMNLIENAVEYCRPGGAVRIAIEARDGRFTLRVTNPVVDLKSEDVPRLFDRFWRKDAARSGSEHFGLGLSMVRAFAGGLGYDLNAALDGEGRLCVTLEGPARLEGSAS